MLRFLPLLLAAFALASCGGDEDSSATQAVTDAEASGESGLTDEEAKALFRSTFFVETRCSKIDLGPVPGADKPYGVGATREDIADLEDEVDARVDEIVEIYETVEDPNAKLAPFEGATAKSLLRGPLYALQQGCGSNSARWALEIEDALDGT